MPYDNPSQDEEDEQEEEEESYEEASPAAKKPRVTPNYGFQPLEAAADQPEEALKPQNEKTKKLKQQINRIVLQYPQLQIRCSSELIKKLDQYSEEDLQNIFMNAINDVTTLRGTPSAECFLLPTKMVDSFVPGYSEVCKKDEPLKRDIELLWLEWVGYLGTIGNIGFSLLRNINTAYEEAKKNVVSHAFPTMNGEEIFPQTSSSIDPGFSIPSREPTTSQTKVFTFGTPIDHTRK